MSGDFEKFWAGIVKERRKKSDYYSKDFNQTFILFKDFLNF
jgi:hypothetical protein